MRKKPLKRMRERSSRGPHKRQGFRRGNFLLKVLRGGGKGTEKAVRKG